MSKDGKSSGLGGIGVDVMPNNEQPRDGKPGTTDQWPRWEGPKGNRPRGYLPAKDDPDVDRDAAGENNRDPEKNDLSDALKQKGE
jgi:hypothetical protein